MKNYFYNLADFACSKIKSQTEVLLLSFYGEKSDFCRLNHNKIRQAGTVVDQEFEMKLVMGQRHVSSEFTLSGEATIDQQTVNARLSELRETIKVVPDDPHFLYNTTNSSSESIDANELVNAQDMVSDIVKLAEGLDLVGILAAGGIFRGFANSLGQKNWFEKYTFNFDWSVYLQADKAVKSRYAGMKWDIATLRHRMDTVRGQLEQLKKEPKSADPGKYDVYLAPAAIASVMELLSWGGFGEKAMRVKSSPLLKMVSDKVLLSKDISISDNRIGGTEPMFDFFGFKVEGKVDLIRNGAYVGGLVSPRTAREFDMTPNSAHESAESLELLAGSIKQEQILAELGTGIFISDLWYLNYSDVSHCKITGMTRFASFWVENGEIVAPLNVMRFDDSIFALFGKNLKGLTSDLEFMLSPASYGGRSAASLTLPGAMIRDMNFTL